MNTCCIRTTGYLCKHGSYWSITERQEMWIDGAVQPSLFTEFFKKKYSQNVMFEFSVKLFRLKIFFTKKRKKKQSKFMVWKIVFTLFVSMLKVPQQRPCLDFEIKFRSIQNKLKFSEASMKIYGALVKRCTCICQEGLQVIQKLVIIMPYLLA